MIGQERALDVSTPFCCSANALLPLASAVFTVAPFSGRSAPDRAGARTCRFGGGSRGNATLPVRCRIARERDPIRCGGGSRGSATLPVRCRIARERGPWRCGVGSRGNADPGGSVSDRAGTRILSVWCRIARERGSCRYRRPALGAGRSVGLPAQKTKPTTKRYQPVIEGIATSAGSRFSKRG